MPTAKTWRLKSPLLQRMRDLIRTEHKSPRTEEAYVHWCADFFAWSNCGSVDCLDGQSAERYLTHLAVDRHVSASTQNQAFNALLYLFRRVLEKDFGKVKAERAKRAANVPEWLTKHELKELFEQLSGDWLLLARLGYGTGLRLMELLRLRVKDVDFGNGMVIVRDGKGGNNRLVPLPKSLVEPLKMRVAETTLLHQQDSLRGFGSVWMPDALAKKYPTASKSLKWQWLFPSRQICKAEDSIMRRHHLFPNGFQTELRNAGVRANIPKRVHPHCLRHSFATHFLENGGSLPVLQKLMGHKEITTTMIYTHCVDLNAVRSPLDQL